MHDCTYQVIFNFKYCVRVSIPGWAGLVASPVTGLVTSPVTGLVTSPVTGLVTSPVSVCRAGPVVRGRRETLEEERGVRAEERAPPLLTQRPEGQAEGVEEGVW